MHLSLDVTVRPDRTKLIELKVVKANGILADLTEERMLFNKAKGRRFR